MNSNGGAGEHCDAFSNLHTESHNSVMELVALSKATTLVAHRYQPHISLLVDLFDDPLIVRISPDGFKEWIK